MSRPPRIHYVHELLYYHHPLAVRSVEDSLARCPKCDFKLNIHWREQIER
jgi:hypothetical protein